MLAQAFDLHDQDRFGIARKSDRSAGFDGWQVSLRSRSQTAAINSTIVE
jgi:hypothetical protein